MVTHSSAKYPWRRSTRTSRQSCVNFSMVNRFIRLLRVTNPMSCPKNHRARASRLECRRTRPPGGSAFGRARGSLFRVTQSSRTADHLSDGPDADASEEPSETANRNARACLVLWSCCPEPTGPMRSAEPSSVLSLPYTDAAPEMCQLSAHATATSRVTHLCCRCSNRWFHRLERRQPFRERIARARCLEATRW